MSLFKKFYLWYTENEVKMGLKDLSMYDVADVTPRFSLVTTGQCGPCVTTLQGSDEVWCQALRRKRSRRLLTIFWTI